MSDNDLSVESVDAPVEQPVEHSSERMRWYAIQVIFNGESTVQQHIGEYAARCNVAFRVGRVLFPVEMVNEIRNGKKYTRKKKLYPGYLFIELDLYDEDGKLNHGVWQCIRSMNGVARIIGGNEPMPIAQSDIDAIEKKMQVSNDSSKFKCEFSPGMLVKVMDGPFLGLEGEVETVDEEKGCACVQVSLFGRSTPVELEFWKIAKKEM
ncbi:MAG: transcription termination/antitermination protein NusG [Puniceicoccales bacterium]|jgi:transcriptional antiterminator NusG|nr:transcription termination/antitermination protein NusG [Puniceicoccales bacterium]